MPLSYTIIILRALYSWKDFWTIQKANNTETFEILTWCIQQNNKRGFIVVNTVKTVISGWMNCV